MLSWSRSSKACLKAGKGFGVGLSKRGLVVSPATNENPAHNFAPVLPFGFDFVSDELRERLVSRGVDVDSLERKYNVQIQNDAEFNNPVLPSEGSPLWGFIYANRLVKCKVELSTLGKNEEYMLNYLRAQIEELEQRMKRYYPNLDWKGEYGRQLNDSEEFESNVGFLKAKTDAITSFICDNENGDDKYVGLFGNNSFISNEEYDENDKFRDFLPKELEEKMTKWYNFYYSHSSESCDAREYFDSVKKLEKLIETPMNALSKEIKQNYGLFLLDCFGNNSLDLVSSMVNTFSSASSSIVDCNSKGSVSDCLSLLDLKSGKINEQSGDILGRLFFGNGDAGKQLSGKDVNEVSSILASAGEDRISLIYRGLSIENSLKSNSIARVFLAVLLKMNREFMGQFMTNGDNIDSFSSSNSSLMDNIVSSQKKFNASSEKLSVAFGKFVSSATNSIVKDRKNATLKKEEISSLIRSLMTNQVSNVGNVDCVIASSLKEYGEKCGENGDIFGQLTGLTYSKYVENCGNSIFWYQLFNGIVNPARNGISGRTMSSIAEALVNNSSDASEALFSNVGSYLHENGALNESEAGSIASSLSSLVANDWDAFKTACNEFNSARVENENALRAVSLNMDESFQFEHIAQTYDPLNVHLAQFRYLSNN